VCDTQLVETNERYSTEQLFALWRPLRFSEDTVLAHLRQAERTTLFRCDSCGLEMFLPQVIGNDRFYTEAYGLEGEDRNGVLPYAAAKWDFTEATKDLNGVKRLLEVGSGPGHFLDLAAKHVAVVEGVESNPIARRTCEKRGHKVYRDLDECRTVPPFDAAMSFHVLEHVADPVGFLRSMGVRIRPGGIVGVSLPNRAGPIRFINPCAQDMPPHHATRWRPRTLRRLGGKLGWKVERLVLEPLDRENWYYYADYVPRYLFPRTTPIAGALRAIAGRAVRATLRMADLLPWPRLLVGPAMYVAYRMPVVQAR
jgi:SAM-dependent methyltransferase